MIGLVFLMVWYLTGVVTLTVWWRQELDVTLGDLIIILFGAIAGPASLVLPLLSWLDKKEIVVFKGKNK